MVLKASEFGSDDLGASAMGWLERFWVPIGEQLVANSPHPSPPSLDEALPLWPPEQAARISARETGSIKAHGSQGAASPWCSLVGLNSPYQPSPCVPSATGCSSFLFTLSVPCPTPCSDFSVL